MIIIISRCCNFAHLNLVAFRHHQISAADCETIARGGGGSSSVYQNSSQQLSCSDIIDRVFFISFVYSLASPSSDFEISPVWGQWLSVG